jgi:hypothetical protein
MASDDRHSGGCLCGAIRFRLTGDPIDGNICYCTQCRRQTGSPMVAFVTYPADRFELLSGTPASFRASTFATRQFCSGCGTPLSWRRDGREDMDVFLGSLDHPEMMPKPPKQLWTQHRLPWVPAMPEIRAFLRSPSEG